MTMVASWDTALVGKDQVDAYLATCEEPKRGTLEQLRRTILEVVPDAEQTISYGMPAFKLRGKTVAGFAAFKNHLSYLPHSGSVLPALRVTAAARRWPSSLMAKMSWRDPPVRTSGNGSNGASCSRPVTPSNTATRPSPSCDGEFFG